MPKKPTRDLAKEKFWRQAIARHAVSGLSQQEFCKREGINPNTFSTWKEIIRQRDADGTGVKISAPAKKDMQERATFVPIAVAGVESVAATAPFVVAELHPSGLVCILSGADFDTLRALLTALKECKR